MDQETLFFGGSESKEAFFKAKEHRLNKPPKFAFFSKGLVHGFCPKMEVF